MKDQVEWNESMETGIIEIDIQHRNLFNTLKILRDALEHNKSALIIKYIIEEIARYSQYHILAESEILRKYNLLDLKHEIEHRFFKIKIIGFKRRYVESESKELAYEICDYLHLWITMHIMVTDKDAMDALKKEFKRLGKGEKYLDELDKIVE